MSPFIGTPIGFNPATLALLDTALTEMYADFERAKAKAPIPPRQPALLASEIKITRIVSQKPPASIVTRKRSEKSAASNLRFNENRGWYLR
jgi:hypothetical protein